jgi:hypothetical protein
MGEEFERAKSYLQVADEKGVTLYDHVAELILKLIKEKPDPDTGACDRQRRASNAGFAASGERCYEIRMRMFFFLLLLLTTGRLCVGPCCVTDCVCVRVRVQPSLSWSACRRP